MRLTIGHALILGLVARLVALAFLPDLYFPDAQAYVTAGRELFETGSMHVHRYMPLYPAWTYATGGGWLLKLADIGLSVATIWIIYRLAEEIFGDRRVAVLAAMSAAIYPHFIFYSITGLTETAFLFLLSLAFLCFYQGRWLGGFVLLVLSILVRPSIELLAPVLIAVFVVVVHRHGWRIAVLRIAQYAAVYAVLMSPWWAHQYIKYDRFVRLNLADGLVWLSGNNPANRTGGGVDRDESADAPSAKPSDVDSSILGRFASIPDEYEQNEAMRRAAFQYIRENPGRFVEMAGIKFVRFWRLWPYAPEYEKPVTIAASLLSYGVMLALALWFLGTAARPYLPAISPILLLTAFLTAVHMATISSIRYRFPLEGFLVIFGCYSLARLGVSWPALGSLYRRFGI